LVFCGYLVFTGIARFLVEIIRINPRSFFGVSNAQAASVASVLLGIALFFVFARRPTEASPRLASK
jgi:phosphatidylglycerol:prolipoprotein diacylglycerol transferase